MIPGDSLFGAVRLGYVVIETERFADWRRFGADAIGMHADESAPDHLRFRLDDHRVRFLLRRGPAEDVVALGWQIDDHEVFDATLARALHNGIPVMEGTDEQAALRGVQRLTRLPGPGGLVQELFTRADTTSAPLDARVRGGFVTGDHGMGHVAITTKNPAEMRGYYDGLFDARLSDMIDETISGVKLKIRFLRVNQRHHSVAIANVRRLPINPIRTNVQHLNIQVAELDDMLAAYERVRELGFRMALTVGQHTNDRELSFYTVTPSGFEWEVGWNPLIVDERTWEPTTHQGISIWGHAAEEQSVRDRVEQVRSAAKSLWTREYSVPMADM